MKCSNTAANLDLSNCETRKATGCQGCKFLIKELNMNEDEDLINHFIEVTK